MWLCHMAGLQPLKSDLIPVLFPTTSAECSSFSGHSGNGADALGGIMVSFPCGGIDVSWKILLPYIFPTPSPQDRSARSESGADVDRNGCPVQLSLSS